MIRLTKFDVKLVKESSKNYNFDSKKITSPEVATEMIDNVLDLKNATQEIFGIVTLDTQNNITGIFEVTRGLLNSSLVHAREVFQRAILQNAKNIILFHNHPSGDIKPSKEDILTTNNLTKAGDVIGINILDHIIITDTNFTSLKQEGYL